MPPLSTSYNTRKTVINFMIAYAKIKCQGRFDKNFLEKMTFEMNFGEKVKFL